MKYEFKIRQENIHDIPAVFEINRIAFGQDNEAKLVDRLRYNEFAFIPELSIVATENNKIVGHILFTKIGIKDAAGNLHESLGLAPMAVLPELQKNGIGEKLIEYGFDIAKKLGYKSIIVLGHEHYYPKFGFEPAERWDIKAPFEVPSNVFMAIELVNDGLKDISGTVIYPKEFENI